MRKIREVLRLKWESRLSHRAIARSCGISPGTVSDYVQRAQAAGLSWPLPADLTEETLAHLRTVRVRGQPLEISRFKGRDRT